MKLILAVGLTLGTGFAQAAKQVDIPVEVIAVQVEQNQQPRWEESRNIPHDKAVSLIAAGEKAGGACHELTAQSTVVCFFQGSRSAGIDWKKLSTELGNQSDLTQGTTKAAEAVAYSYLSSRFIVVAPPKIEGDQALVTAMLMGQECTLKMSSIAATPQNKYGWSIYGEVCGPISAAEQNKWTTDNFGKPHFTQP